MNDTPMTNVINMARQNGIFDDSVAADLQTRLGDKTVGTIGTTKFALAEQLGDAPNAFKVAGDLLAFMRDAELIDLPGATATTTQTAAQPLNLVIPPRRNEMGLADLLRELVKCPEDADELIELIRQQPVVIQANAKLNGNGKWAIATGGNLDVDLTVKFIRYLAHPRNPAPTGMWGEGDGHWPTTLENALGREQRLMIYPLALDEGEVFFNGIDRFGNNWATLSDDLHEALIAAIAQRKLTVSNQTDARRLTHEVFTGTLPGYLQDLVNEYKRDKELGDKVERYATEAQARAIELGRLPRGSRLPFGGSSGTKHDESWYREQLKAIAQAPIVASSGNVREHNCVLQSVRTNSGGVRLMNVIVLGDVSTNSGEVKGTIYLAPGRRVRTNSGANGADVHVLSWENLYNKAVELGLL